MLEKNIGEMIDKINKGDGNDEDFVEVAEIACKEIAKKLKEKDSGVNRETVLYLSSVNINPAEINGIIPFIIKKLIEEGNVEEVDGGRYKYIGENNNEERQESMIAHEIEKAERVVGPSKVGDVSSFKKLAKDSQYHGIESRSERRRAGEKIEKDTD